MANLVCTITVLDILSLRQVDTPRPTQWGWQQVTQRTPTSARVRSTRLTHPDWRQDRFLRQFRPCVGLDFRSAFQPMIRRTALDRGLFRFLHLYVRLLLLVCWPLCCPETCSIQQRARMIHKESDQNAEVMGARSFINLSA